MKKSVIFSAIALVGLLGCNRTTDNTSSSAPPATTGQTQQTAPGTARTGLPEMSDADRQFAQRVENDLHKSSAAASAAQNIHVYAHNGEVTLQGSVNNEQEKANIGSAVQQMAGVTKVDNQIQIANASR